MWIPSANVWDAIPVQQHDLESGLSIALESEVVDHWLTHEPLNVGVFVLSGFGPDVPKFRVRGNNEVWIPLALLQQLKTRSLGGEALADLLHLLLLFVVKLHVDAPSRR
jgi:hypothetical protein